MEKKYLPYETNKRKNRTRKKEKLFSENTIFFFPISTHYTQSNTTNNVIIFSSKLNRIFAYSYRARAELQLQNCVQKCKSFFLSLLILLHSIALTSIYVALLNKLYKCSRCAVPVYIEISHLVTIELCTYIGIIACSCQVDGSKSLNEFGDNCVTKRL